MPTNDIWARRSPNQDLWDEGVTGKDFLNSGIARGGIGTINRNEIGTNLINASRKKRGLPGPGASPGNTSNMIFPAPSNTPTPNVRYAAPNPQGPGPDWLSSHGSWGGGDANVPTLDLAPYDLNRVEALAQRASAPGQRRLRNEMQTVQQGVYENPNVKAMTMRQALSGYGQGLEGIMGGAYKEGRAQYGEERGIEDTEAKSNWEAKLRASLMRYQRDLYPPRTSGRGSGFSAY